MTVEALVVVLGENRGWQEPEEGSYYGELIPSMTSPRESMARWMLARKQEDPCQAR